MASRVFPRRQVNDLGEIAVRIIGVINGEAQPGEESNLTAEMTDSSTILTRAWGSVFTGTEFGSGVNPDPYVIADGGDLFLTVTTNAGTFHTSAPIRYPAPVLDSQPVGPTYNNNSGVQSFDISVYVTFAGDPEYSIISGPVTINSSGEVLTDTDALNIQADTPVTARVADANDTSRFLDIDFTFSIIAQGTVPVNPTTSDIIFTDNNDGTTPQLQVLGGYTGPDSINGVFQFKQGSTLRATRTALNLTVVNNAFDFTLDIDDTDLIFEAGSSASDIPNIDSIDVTIVENANGGLVGPVNEPVSGLSIEAPIITWATNSLGTQIIGTGNKNLHFTPTPGDIAINNVNAGTPTIDSITGSGSLQMIINISGNLPAAGETDLTIDFTNSVTNLRGPDANEVADFAAVPITNNISAGILDDFNSFADGALITTGPYVTFGNQTNGLLIKKTGGIVEFNTDTTPSEHTVRHTTSTGSSDHEAIIQHIFDNTDLGCRVYIVVGATDDPADGFYLVRFLASGDISIREIIGNTDQGQIGSGNFSHTPGVAQNYAVERDFTSGAIIPKVGGVATNAAINSGETTYSGQYIGFGKRMAGSNVQGDQSILQFSGGAT